MSRPERQQNVLDLLKGLRGIEPLKQLFWSELNYQRVNQPLSRRGWSEAATKALAEDPVLFAGGGDDNAFHVIYCRLAADGLPRTLERPVVSQLLREHPYALFIFSDKSQTDWHFLNVKFDDQAERRQLYRRITVRPGAGLRTATERVQLLDLAEIHPDLFGITPLAIQQRCDAAFDVEAVTKDFFREVANWYFWALKHAEFPKDAPKEDDGHDHISIIRLITRLIFCWFVKEKGLIPDTLFDQQKLAQILTGFEPAKASAKGSVFYKAILQNLFFATLNTEMDKRAWRKDDNNFMAHILYRHRALFQKPNEALDYFKNIPFLNGGLFECLDKREGTTEKPKDIRIDGFSDRSDSQPTVPDFLFFGGEREVDLSAEYDDKKFKSVPVRGLIHIFNRYNFTVEEDTPIDQEVALDPELSGKVFENLLAAYNPETGATARKQTGSFYTPREIVNYMVDESLIACLKTKLETALPSAKDVEIRLRQLFAYTDEPHQFTAPEVDALIAIIDSLKTLDPAVGSGAFPMGILHKLVFILGKLDPRNEKWKERQIARVRDTMATAEKIEDATARERAGRELEQQIAGINEAFEHNELDYGRKLYLIENCIYGVDIQPIAVQIAKMRFFISLIVDQKIDDKQANRGVRPLPNLETKFVAANTLIGVNRPGQQMLRNRDIEAKETELRRVRQSHFDAKTPKQKTKCREQDATLRTEIAELLKSDGWDTATARKLASWNPYDQNASADFFDPEWMFGICDGFDIIIGNPPYGIEISAELTRMLDEKFYKHKSSTRNSAIYFIYLANEFLTARGSNAFIVPKSLCYSAGWRPCARFLVTELRRLIDMGKAFENVLLEQVVFVRNKQKPCVSFTNGLYEVNRIFEMAEVDKGIFEKSKVLLAGQTSNEIKLIVRINNYFRQTLADLVRFERGLNWQSKVSRHSGKTPIHRGAQLDKWFLHKATDFINLGAFDTAEYDYQMQPKILNQLAIAHVQNPYPHFYLQATLDEHGKTLVFETISCTFAKTPNINLKFILGLNNSLLFAWLLYKFVYSNAIRSTRYDGEYVGRIPVPDMPPSAQQPIIGLVDRILAAKRDNPNAVTSTLERKIDQQVYALYGLTQEEIKIVENATT
jgi:hypothetical protein